MMDEFGSGVAHLARGSAVTASRRIAAELCADMRNGTMLDPAFEHRTVALEARDRRWTQELVYGMLRRRSMLDAQLSVRVRGGLARLDPDLIDLLRLGADQLLHMRSVPAYAAIAQTVELAKERHGLGASKLANAVLRRLDRERENLTVEPHSDPTEALALEHSHPRWLVARWIARWGAEEAARLLAANNTEPPVVLRPYNIVREQLEAMLESAGVHVLDVPLMPDSLQLAGGASLTSLGAYRQGLFFVQDPGSTLVTKYAAIPNGSLVADLCAAPGGKTLELSRSAGSVIACDRSAVRIERMTSNIARVDARSVHTIVADARYPAIKPADAVLLDVPCTGTGTFRRHPDARWRLKMSDLAVMSALQRVLLKSAATVVKPGGLLVYSTCSLEPEENDEQIESFLAGHSEWTLEPPPEGAVPPQVLDSGRLRVLPQRHDVDGAFAARLRRIAA
ncbi:MAG: 16S rRNA (cytosine(967)-C(5))-methyltransferase RsmB [Gemmatimonadaceae bacterium]|nr:16S rRNA (cytosine(967)-C(5))-methyltransferase RsmB [Gemmatimonadaceae bacterium]MDQ3520172.1 16S rRNA (cytosine(967)-C(5))-methyltransferase RsmB [Gemmatimonadota bacterium]